ncbi:DUF3899 domain-containing protein [Bacillus dakarensis]|uniref:DUF3899 domain-containing protein n=1 Tax=Robertmurraya dakarensis TaxID=1926278 RepID=UPI0009FF8B6C|nr:DUF3899 domain-containing protein [Bacillus dakarensis]
MKKHWMPAIYLFACSQIAIVLFSFILYQKITLLFYINISFYLGSLYIFLSLIFFTVKSGFFDFVTKSFRLIFAGKDVTKKQVEEMLPLSKVISFNYSPLFINGLLVTLLMLVALYLYYF